MRNKNKFLYMGISLIAVSFFVSTGVVAAPPAPSSVCGNGICENDETILSCSVDCNPCGDGECDAEIGETPVTCSLDCFGAVCGDGTCDDGESIETCPNDCHLPEPQPDPGIATPSCEDVTIHVGEETTCSIKVENIETFPLTEVTAEVVIPNNIEKINNTDSWNCVSTVEGTQCQKMYNPYLIMGEIEYLELTLTTDTEGTYGLSATINGQGETFQAVTYTSSEQITTTEPVTATAMDDYAGDHGDNGGCWMTITMDIADNDTVCSSGTTSFSYYNLNAGATVNSFDTATGIINIDLSGGHLFDYDILCNGVVIDSAAAYCFAA